MVVEARIRVRHHGCISETLTGSARAVQISSDREADVLVMHADEEARVTRFHEQVNAVLPVPPEVMSRTATSILLRGRGIPDGVVSAILASGCSVLWPALFHDGHEHYSLVAPSRERLEGLVERLRKLGDVRVERAVEVAADALPASAPLAGLAGELTERQLSVLLRAIEDGYYDSPRRTSAEALALAHGVTRTTLEEHLRKAESRVLASFATLMRSQPGLARAATRRPGRPPRAPPPEAQTATRAEQR